MGGVNELQNFGEKVPYNKVVYGTLVFTAPVLSVLSVWLEALGPRIKIETDSLPNWSLLRRARFKVRFDLQIDSRSQGLKPDREHRCGKH